MKNKKYVVKAKRIDNGDWIRGYLWNGNDHAYIIPHNIGIGYDAKSNKLTATAYEVDKETVCRYVGLAGKNITEIWENDIVKFDDCGVYPIWWDEEYKAFGSCQFSDFDHLSKYRTINLEVVGNVFDNAEMLE